jgi:hypothetical protein
VPNPDQTDANFNGLGAACDPAEDGDIDNDSVPDATDNCPLDANTNQADVDADGYGDACDPDDDGDTVSNDDDNCLNTPNPDQADSDGDFLGDACDACPNDKDDSPAYSYVKDPITGKPTVKPLVPDSDGDGIPDACDGATGKARLQVDGHDFRPASGPRPDGSAHMVRIMGQPGQIVSIPVPLCIGACPAAAGTNQCVALELSGLRGDLHASISEDSGRGIAKLSRGVTSGALRFQPKGGRRYFLLFLLTPGFRGSEDFSMSERACVRGDRSSGVPGGPVPPDVVRH